ncbi:MAG: NAD-dependent epimerase/dehydratase family protein [Sulfobacillus sp.]
MRVLVTGGAGFIGSHLVEKLVKEGKFVRVFDDLSTGKRENVPENAEFVLGDCRYYAQVLSACADMDAVVHLAALGSVPRSLDRPREVCENNVLGFVNVLEAARSRGIRRVVYASSSSVYGDAEVPWKEQVLGNQQSPYAATKFVCEVMSRTYHRCYGMETVGLRYFNVYGSRQSTDGPYVAVIPKWASALKEGRPIEVHGDGRQSRDFTHVSDAVAGTCLALETENQAAFGESFNIAGGRAVSLVELLQKMERALAKTPTEVGRTDDHNCPRLSLPVRKGDIHNSLADLMRSQEVLGYRPRVTLEEGITTLI